MVHVVQIGLAFSRVYTGTHIQLKVQMPYSALFYENADHSRPDQALMRRVGISKEEKGRQCHECQLDSEGNPEQRPPSQPFQESNTNSNNRIYSRGGGHLRCCRRRFQALGSLSRILAGN